MCAPKITIQQTHTLSYYFSLMLINNLSAETETETFVNVLQFRKYNFIPSCCTLSEILYVSVNIHLKTMIMLLEIFVTVGFN